MSLGVAANPVLGDQNGGTATGERSYASYLRPRMLSRNSSTVSTASVSSFMDVEDPLSGREFGDAHIAGRDSPRTQKPQTIQN